MQSSGLVSVQPLASLITGTDEEREKLQTTEDEYEMRDVESC